MPTFVVVDREYGIMAFSTFKYTSDTISFIGENYWETSEVNFKIN